MLCIHKNGVPDDSIPKECKLGMEAGFEIGQRMDTTVIYTDLGVSKGMEEGVDRAILDGRPIEWRSLHSSHSHEKILFEVKR